MLNLLKKWLSKEHNDNNDELDTYIPTNEAVTFVLKVNDIELGILKIIDGNWYFKYTEEFKKHRDEYNYIVGFPDIDREYKSEFLWPFFQIRIPGLKQPSVKKILENEKIDRGNEAELLKRFGRKTIANPYELEAVY